MRNGASGLGRILFKFCTAISTQTGCTGPAGVVCIPTITPSTRLFPGGSVVKNLPTNAGDWGLVPGSGRSPGEGNVNPLQYSCLGNPKGQEAAGYSPWGIKRVGHNLATKQQQSPPTRDQTLVPSIARQTLNHRTTRQVSHKLLFPSSLERGS